MIGFLLRIPTDRRLATPVLLCLLLSLPAAAFALDVFSLWRRPELTIDLRPGVWVEYRTQTIEGGRQQHDHLRAVCVAADEGGWTIEILPMRETDGGSAPVPGEGWVFDLSSDLVDREGDLVDHLRRVVHWQDGRARVLPDEEWREDPLVAASLRASRDAVETVVQEETVRVIADRELVCRQFSLTSADTGRVELPRGVLIQIDRRETSVAANETIPFLGVAYAAERSSTQSNFIGDGSRRRRAPPPSRRIEIMELVDFGENAVAQLSER